MALPTLVLLLLIGLAAVGAVMTRMRCEDAARDAALAAARGESGAAAGARSAPDGAQVAVTVEGDTVRAVVRAPVRPVVKLLPPIVVSAEAIAAVEPGLPVPAP